MSGRADSGSTAQSVRGDGSGPTDRGDAPAEVRADGRGAIDGLAAGSEHAGGNGHSVPGDLSASSERAADRPGMSVDWADMQGLLRFGFKHHTDAVFLLLRVRDAAAARRWLSQVEPTSAVTLDPVPPTALQIALTRAGLDALGVKPDAVSGFSEEFLEGMAGDTNRTRRLGDVGASAPEQWDWGRPDREPHVAVLLYAMPGHLAELQRMTESACADGFDVMSRLSTTDMGGAEPFGFADGLSQPEIDWARTLPAEDELQLTYRNLSCLGEFVLGYPNEYGLYTPRPVLDASRDPRQSLPRAEDSPDSADLGRHGSYLVIRQLRQDVRGFWQALDARSDGVDIERERLAAQLVGRTRTGEPIAVESSAPAGGTMHAGANASAVGAAVASASHNRHASGGAMSATVGRTTSAGANGGADASQLPHASAGAMCAGASSAPGGPATATAGDDQQAGGHTTSTMVGRTTSATAGGGAGPGQRPSMANEAGGRTRDLNAFTFESDPAGHRCPIGAHIRRTNPRNADLPAGGTTLISKLIRILGLDSDSRARDLAASTRFHRVLRRGREYGTHVTPDEALRLQAPVESGLYFMCLNANIQRQFEFVQGAWLMSTHFNGLHNEADPLLGNRKPAPGGLRCDYFSMPQADGPTRRLENLPQFITVAGGAYFFLPGIRALRWLAADAAPASNTQQATTPAARSPTVGAAPTIGITPTVGAAPTIGITPTVGAAPAISITPTAGAAPAIGITPTAGAAPTPGTTTPPVTPPPNLDSNTARPIPPANTGSRLLNMVSDTTFKLLQLERRFDRILRPPFDAILRDPIARLTTALINRQRTHEGLALAEEKLLPGEEEFVDSIIDTFQKQMRGLWKPRGFERGGNTKTHGIVRAELIVHPDLPERFRHGVFAKPQTFRAWVRFSGPGPYITPDIDDVGFMSISIKLLGVPGPKLMDEEKFTQDFSAVSTPTFVTPDVKANAQLQKESLKNASIFYFVNSDRPHLLDFIMQGLWVKTQSSPFEAPYFGCVPYLLGEGQAMQYSVWPKTTERTPIPRLPFRPPDNYLREAMVKALNGDDVELDFRIQLQTDSFLMPLENAAVLWPEKLSPRVSVATLRIPRQKFDSPAQINFEKQLSYNPWHCIPEHRPLGNQSRARKRIYLALSTFRHQMNAVPHYEPTGDEIFE